MATWTWGNTLVLEDRQEVGYAARQNRGRFAGTFVHALRTTYVVGVVPGAVLTVGSLGERFVKTGRPVLFSARPLCGSTQGQYGGKPQDGLTVTCSKCLKKLNH